jgi:hypothetical protein
MCLDVVTKRYDPPIREERWAWKVVLQSTVSEDFTFEYWALYNCGFVPLGIWITAEHQRVHIAYDQGYTSGFHCLTTKKSAERWRARDGSSRCKIIRVKVRRIRTRGRQGCCSVIVCDEMFVPKPSVKPKTGRAGK